MTYSGPAKPEAAIYLRTPGAVMLFKVALSVAGSGAVMFWLGLKRQSRRDTFNVSLISPTALQIFGGAMAIGGAIVALLAYLRGLA
jgi:hypothetical protein